MKLNDLISNFEIALNNEEKKLLRRFDGIVKPEQFTEREQTIIDGMVRKSVVSKIVHNGKVYLVKNETNS
jgi:hypothetical protein